MPEYSPRIFWSPVPLENTILGPACSFSPQGGGLHSAWDDLSVPLSIPTTLVHNLIKVPAAVLRSRVAKDAEVLALRHENVVLRRQIAQVRYEPADRIWLAVLFPAGPAGTLAPRIRCHADHAAGLAPATHCAEVDVLPAPPPRQAVHRAHRQAAHPAPGQGEQYVGPPPHTGRTRAPGLLDRPVHGRRPELPTSPVSV
ncbi:hypothetical protein [Streptomyces sp. NPDC002573]|uniref:hypothetical protein n=1 Tax=Streptomyces sp. NPDC002573 TaxID=3364651 RepID=UPI0036AC2135